MSDTSTLKLACSILATLNLPREWLKYALQSVITHDESEGRLQLLEPSTEPPMEAGSLFLLNRALVAIGNLSLRSSDATVQGILELIGSEAQLLKG
jgi:hypothetical protein